MYSQTYSLVGTEFNNYVLNSFRKGLTDASELSVQSPSELLEIFQSYHFNPIEITSEFTLLAESPDELSDIYESLYKYSYANADKVTVTRESVASYMSYSDTTEYIRETFRRLLKLLAVHKDASLVAISGQLSELLFVYSHILRTSMVTQFTINTSDNPSFVFVELPEQLYTELQPVWYIACSLGILPSLKRPFESKYIPSETINTSSYNNITLPQLETVKRLAEDDDRLLNGSEKASNTTLSPEEIIHTFCAESNPSIDSYVEKLLGVCASASHSSELRHA